MPMISIDNWTYCTDCYVRENHIYDSETKTWRCEVCGKVNNYLTQIRKAVRTVAESYLEDNPEE
jgi:PHP family Zn ribbon phosphoesterase